MLVCLLCMCVCFVAIFFYPSAACLAGTITMVVSTGWLLGNNYLTVLCLHRITQRAVCVCLCWGMEKYSTVVCQKMSSLMDTVWTKNVCI